MAAARVSIPAAVRRTIQNIKEIAGGHTDEEVYAALRECDMDPNETVQKLLFQDTFHEVKRKREKKKESNKESADPRWRHGTQGRGGKAGRGNYSSRNSSDLTGRNALAGKENELNPSMEKCSSSSPVNPSTDTKISTSISSLSGGLSNGPSQPLAAMAKNSVAMFHLPSSDSKGPADLKGAPEEVMDLVSDPSQLSTQPPPSIPGVCTIVSDQVLTPSLEAYSHGEIVASKHAFRSQRAAAEYKVVSDDVSVVPKDTSQPSGSSSIVLPSGSRPSSSYSSRSQQPSGSQKAVPNKEWKPKPTNKPTQAENVTRDDVAVTVEVQSVPVLTSAHKEDISSEMCKRLGDVHLFDKQHVIIPDHLQVTESEKYGLSFGSFGTSFDQTVGFPNDHECDKSSVVPEYESSHAVDEIVEEPAPSHEGATSTVEAATQPGLQHLTADKANTISHQEVDNSSNPPKILQSDENSAASHTPPDLAQNMYSTFEVPPQSQGNQTPLLETSEYQVQQPNDFSANYYAQLYRPIAGVDGHLSPFTVPGAPIKSGNVSVLPTQTGQAQEELDSMAQSSSGPTQLATPAPGVLPNSIAIPQQPLPVFRQPVGLHVPHYQPSFFPYNQYLSPFYVPPHALHHFVGNAAYPQAPSPGNMYPPVSSAVAPPVKYSAATYKPGANTGSQTYTVTPGAYGTYGSSPSVYTNNNVVPSGTSADNGDVSGSQFKENNIYIAGQQSEGSTVWIPAPGRELSTLQSSTYYGLPPQGQHLAFAPAQAGHGAYAGMYHPAQTLAGGAVHPLLQPSQTIAGAVEMVGPPSNGYQQQQHAQMNWGSY